MNIQEKTLDNKSRKGDYYYIKEPGKRGRYIKKTPELTRQALIKFVKSGGKGKTVLKHYKAASRTSRQQALRKTIHRRTRWDKGLRKGIAETSFNLAEVSTADAQLINRRLAKQLVKNPKDKDIVNIIAQNLHKLKHRTEYHTTIKRREGGNIGTIKDFNKLDVREMISKYKLVLMPHILQSTEVKYDNSWYKITNPLNANARMDTSGNVSGALVKVVIRW